MSKLLRDLRRIDYGAGSYPFFMLFLAIISLRNNAAKCVTTLRRLKGQCREIFDLQFFLLVNIFQAC
jgi:hypothetical protein